MESPPCDGFQQGQNFWRENIDLETSAKICLAKDNTNCRAEKGKTHSLAGKFLVIYI